MKQIGNVPRTECNKNNPFAAVARISADSADKYLVSLFAKMQ